MSVPRMTWEKLPGRAVKTSAGSNGLVIHLQQPNGDHKTIAGRFVREHHLPRKVHGPLARLLSQVGDKDSGGRRMIGEFDDDTVIGA